MHKHVSSSFFSSTFGVRVVDNLKITGNSDELFPGIEVMILFWRSCVSRNYDIDIWDVDDCKIIVNCDGWTPSIAMIIFVVDGAAVRVIIGNAGEWSSGTTMVTLVL